MSSNSNSFASNFEQFNLHPQILRAIQDSGYTTATPIQEQAIPEIMVGHDVMGSANTGTGKTAAFMLPILHGIATRQTARTKNPRTLILVPTRELAMQVNQAGRKYGEFIRPRMVTIIGGMSYVVQNRLLSQPIDILVATPGRLIDHITQGRIRLSDIQTLVLDEADRMLDMGFMPDIQEILKFLPTTYQTLMFSATLEGEIASIAKRLLKNPKIIQVDNSAEKHTHIEQRLHFADDMHHKNKLLARLLVDPTINQAIVFTSTKRHASSLAEELYSAGHKSAALHGDMTQGARNKMISNLRQGSLKVLVATDVAARGIDVQGISHVINFDLPKQAEDYVHRIGRTGRAGKYGVAISFAGHNEKLQLRRIEQRIGQKLEASILEGLEPKVKPATTSREFPSTKRRFGPRQTTHSGYMRRH